MTAHSLKRPSDPDLWTLNSMEFPTWKNVPGKCQSHLYWHCHLPGKAVQFALQRKQDLHTHTACTCAWEHGCVRACAPRSPPVIPKQFQGNLAGQIISNDIDT